MDSRAWWATVHGVYKELDTTLATEQLMQRVDSLEKTLMLGGIGGRRRREDRR